MSEVSTRVEQLEAAISREDRIATLDEIADYTLALKARVAELEGIIQTIRDDIRENGGGSGYYEVPTEMILGALDGKGFPDSDD